MMTTHLKNLHQMTSRKILLSKLLRAKTIMVKFNVQNHENFIEKVHLKYLDLTFLDLEIVILHSVQLESQCTNRILKQMAEGCCQSNSFLKFLPIQSQKNRFY